MGLYSGEQSFLDWRDQSYAAWIVNDLASLASAKALSTNVGHYKALTLAASLAREHGASAQAQRYALWAGALKQAINDRLWLADANMYSSLTAAHLDGAPMHKFDWLGQALAIVTGVADERRARKILASYPHGPMGAPVIYPQQQDMPVYHNRALWPFVTAYGLKAAAMSGNVSVADAAYDTLRRAAALNLSNMENLEWLSGQALLLDESNPSLIGPVINSKRQLWSVGAYLGMVIENVFGISTTADGIALKPFITSRLRREAFGKSDLLELSGLRMRGKRIGVKIRLPKATRANGYYPVAAITVNGVRIGAAIAWDQLAPDSTIEMSLGPLQSGQQAMRRVSADPYAQASAVFSPSDPAAPILTGAATLAYGRAAPGVVYNIYRDGKLVASKLPAGVRTDRDPGAAACYAVEAQFAGSGNRSHHSPPACSGAAQEIPVSDARVKSNVALSAPDARFHSPSLKRWGKPGDTFALGPIQIPRAGTYVVQLRYHNGANQINLGISGGVKWMTLKDENGRIVAQGVVQMPHARLEQGATALVYSTPLAATLGAGAITVELGDFYNMSYLQANSTFSAAGGSSGVSNQFDIHAVRILHVK